jgi:hypothetical protein
MSVLTEGGMGGTHDPAPDGWDWTLVEPYSITLSDSDRIATVPVTVDGEIWSTRSNADTLSYVEVTVTGDDPTGRVGLFNDAVQTGTVLTADGDVLVYAGGAVVETFTDVFDPLENGDIVGIAYDGVNGKVWFRVNGGLWNNDANQQPNEEEFVWPSEFNTGPRITEFEDHNGEMLVTANNTIISGIALNGASWLDGNDDPITGILLNGGIVISAGVHDIIIEDCTFWNFGPNGINVGQGCYNILIRNCYFYGLCEIQEQVESPPGSGIFVNTGNLILDGYPGSYGVISNAYAPEGEDDITAMIVENCNFELLENAVFVSSDSIIRFNYVHDNFGNEEAHPDCIACHGGEGFGNILIEDNFVDTFPEGGTSGIYVTNDFGEASNITINHNRSLARGLAVAPIFLAEKVGQGEITGIVITNNHLDTGVAGVPYILGDATVDEVSGNVDWLTGESVD